MQRILLKCTENNGVEKKIIVVIVQKYNKSQKWRLSSILFPPLKQISEQNWFLFLFNEQFSELSNRTFPFCAKLWSLSDLISNKVLHFHFNNNYYFKFLSKILQFVVTTFEFWRQCEMMRNWKSGETKKKRKPYFTSVICELIS